MPFSTQVGNFANDDDGSIRLQKHDLFVQQQFTTGPEAGNRLSSITVKIKRSNDKKYIRLQAAIRKWEDKGTVLTTLTNSNKFTNHADYKFTDPNKIKLEPSTRYELTITCIQGCANDNFIELSTTEKPDQDSTGLTGWTIADQFHSHLSTGNTDPSGSQAIRMNLVGSTNHPYIVDNGVRSTPFP